MKPVESKEFPGYFEIPGYSNYCIAKDSSILIKSKKKLLNQRKVYGSGSSRKETGYYLRTTLYDDNRKGKPLTVHRLMGLVFKHPGENACRMQVNHIDGIKHHNHIDNLEWVTSKENNTHRETLYEKRKHIPIQLQDAITGTVLNFKTISHAAKFLKIHRTTAIARLEKYRPGFIFPEGYAMRYGNSDAEWPLEEEIMESIIKTPLLVKNLNTGEIHDVLGLNAVRQYIPHSIGTISELINDYKQPCVWGINACVYQVIKKYPLRSFRHVEDPIGELIRRQTTTRFVVAINTIEKKAIVFRKAQDCARQFNLKKTTLSYRLKQGKKKTFDGWFFEYYENNRPICTKV